MMENINIEQQIIEKLHETEKTYDVKIIYAIESGSRGWGFASPDSDYDCRFLYVNRKDWYLAVEDGKDFIEYPVDKVFDVNGWDIKKALRQMRKSNPTLLEWLSSPVVYIENETFTKSLRLLSKQYFNSVHAMHHYLSLAKRSMEPIHEEETAKLKKYFYVLRPLACCRFIMENNDVPLMEYDKVMSNITIDGAVRDEISGLITQKINAMEDCRVPRNMLLYNFFEHEIHILEDFAKTIHSQNNRDLQPLNDYFRKAVGGVWL